MRRLLVPFLLAPLALTAAPASAGCDPETGECHAVDCVAWQPGDNLSDVLTRAGEGEVTAVLLLLPPACPQ